jgi:hypothetical protein
MLVNCPMTPLAGYTRLGCSYRWPTRCAVFLADDRIVRAAGHNPDIVLRHEIGHCNGWGPSHEGARALADINPGARAVVDTERDPNAPFHAILRWFSGR